PSTRTLIRPWAFKAESVSFTTLGVRPSPPIITTGSRWCASARRARRSAVGSCIAGLPLLSRHESPNEKQKGQQGLAERPHPRSLRPIGAKGGLSFARGLQAQRDRRGPAADQARPVGGGPGGGPWRLEPVRAPQVRAQGRRL